MPKPNAFRQNRPLALPTFPFGCRIYLRRHQTFTNPSTGATSEQSLNVDLPNARTYVHDDTAFRFYDEAGALLCVALLDDVSTILSYPALIKTQSSGA